MSSYLGNIPSNNFVSLKRQVITGNGGASYTLDYSVSSVNDVAIFVNNVRQNPSSYSISGTALTLGGTISASDSCYIIFLGQGLQTVTPANNTITNAMLGETISVANGGTGATTLAGAGLSNTPSFLAYRSGNQSITDNTLTKVQFNSVDYDTDSCYDNTTNYRFTPTVAGKYFVYATIRGDSNGDSNIQFHTIQIYKNGSAISYASQNFQANYPRIMNIPISFVVDMNGSTDYLEIFYNMNDISGNPFITEGNKASNFGAYKLIGV